MRYKRQVRINVSHPKRVVEQPSLPAPTPARPKELARGSFVRLSPRGLRRLPQGGAEATYVLVWAKASPPHCPSNQAGRHLGAISWSHLQTGSARPARGRPGWRSRQPGLRPGRSRNCWLSVRGARPRLLGRLVPVCGWRCRSDATADSMAKVREEIEWPGRAPDGPVEVRVGIHAVLRRLIGGSAVVHAPGASQWRTGLSSSRHHKPSEHSTCTSDDLTVASTGWGSGNRGPDLPPGGRVDRRPRRTAAPP